MHFSRATRSSMSPWQNSLLRSAKRPSSNFTARIPETIRTTLESSALPLSNALRP